MLDRHVKPSPDALFREIGGECVLLDLRSGSYFGLNEVGTRIWKLLAGGADLATVLDALVADYEAPEDRLRADLARLVDELVACGLLVEGE